jgi:hypothetical protein
VDEVVEPRGRGVRVMLGTLSVLLMGALVLAYLYRDELADSVTSRYRHYMPVDAQSVVFVDADRMRAGALGDVLPKLVEGAGDEIPPELQALAVGFDDVSELFAASGRDETAVYVLRTDRSLALDAFVKASDGATRETCEGMQCLTVSLGSDRLHAAKVGAATFCLSRSRHALQAALRRVSGKDRSIARHPLRHVLRVVRGCDHFGASTLDEDAGAPSPWGLDGLQALALGITLDERLRGKLVLEFREAGQAAAAEKKVRARIEAEREAAGGSAAPERPPAWAEAAREVLETSRVWRQGAVVHAEASLAAGLVRQLADLPPTRLEEALLSTLHQGEPAPKTGSGP